MHNNSSSSQPETEHTWIRGEFGEINFAGSPKRNFFQNYNSMPWLCQTHSQSKHAFRAASNKLMNQLS
jgi:hypothetical protein